MIGAQGSAYLEKGQWQLGIADRWQRSHRHFVGVEEQLQRRVRRNQVVNNYHLLDLSATYALTDQFNLSLGIPYLIARRSQGSDLTGTRAETQSEGIGDISLVGRWWLGDTRKELDQNISLGFGFKFPTGEYDATDRFRTGTPNPRSVDQSIQPGDGGFGFVLDFSAFKVLNPSRWAETASCAGCENPSAVRSAEGPEAAGEPGATEIAKPVPCPRHGGPAASSDSERLGNDPITTLYATGTYLVNPRNTNGTPTFRGRPPLTPADPAFYETTMSVADQYLVRAGFAFSFPQKPDVTPSIGLRLEGVPVRDLIGGSDGFRRPGYSLSIEPAVAWTLSKGETLSFSIPLAIQRNRKQSVADLKASEVSGRFRQGDAAFADYFVQVAYSRRF